jgi:peptidyl-prolyl cis-trans isomerase D
MRFCKRAVSAVAALLFLVSLCACAAVNGPEAVVATVDGVPIYRWEVDYMFEKNRGYMASFQEIDLNNPDQVLSLKEGFLEQLIIDTAMNLYAEEMGYGLTEEEKARVDEEYRQIKQKAIADYAKNHDGDLTLGEQDYFNHLKEQHLTEDIILQNMYHNAMREKMSADLYASVTSSEDAINEYYEMEIQSDKEFYSDNFAQYEADNAYDSFTVMYHPADYVRFKPIYIAIPKETYDRMLELVGEIASAQSELSILTMQKGESDYSVLRLKREIEEKEAAFDALRQEGLSSIKSRAEEVLNRVNAGEDFDALIAEYGDDEGMDAPPYRDYGYLCSEKTTSFFEEIKTAALALENIGDTIGLIETDAGYFILKLVDKIKEGPREMTEELYDFIESVVSLPDKQDIYNQTAQKALEGREILRYVDRLN